MQAQQRCSFSGSTTLFFYVETLRFLHRKAHLEPPVWAQGGNDERETNIIGLVWEKMSDQTSPCCLALQWLYYIFNTIHSKHQSYNSFDALTISNTLQSVLMYKKMAFRSKTFIIYLEENVKLGLFSTSSIFFHLFLTYTTLTWVSISTKK